MACCSGVLLAAAFVVTAAAGLVPAPALQTPLSAIEWQSWGRLLVWFTWPAWPLMLWTLWRWRRQLVQPHVALPLWAVLVSVVDSAQSDQRDRALLLALGGAALAWTLSYENNQRYLNEVADNAGTLRQAVEESKATDPGPGPSTHFPLAE